VALVNIPQRVDVRGPRRHAQARSPVGADAADMNAHVTAEITGANDALGADVGDE